MVSRQAIWMKKRYAEDPDYRDQQIARSLRHYWTHKDEINEGQRERYQADPEYRELKRKRGRRIPDDVYDVLFALQGGVCAICKKKHHRRLHADHCHVTGKLRGLLCPKCNPASGALQRRSRLPAGGRRVSSGVALRSRGGRSRSDRGRDRRRIAPAARSFVARGIRVAPRGGRAGRLCG